MIAQKDLACSMVESDLNILRHSDCSALERGDWAGDNWHFCIRNVLLQGIQIYCLKIPLNNYSHG